MTPNPALSLPPALASRSPSLRPLRRPAELGSLGRMHTLWIILACFTGVFAFAFLLAGILGLQDTTPPKDRTDAAFQFVDAVVFSGIASVLRGFEKNWSIRREARRLFCGGLACLVAFIVFACLAVSTA